MRRIARNLLLLTTVLLLVCEQVLPIIARAEAASQQRTSIVLTLAADLNKDQKKHVLDYFGVSENDVKIIQITNADEKAHLGNLIPASVIGNRTISCALIHLTTSGGIHVKVANMNYVTSNMIASTLSTSGVYNCEVLTCAPFEVSGTGALTGAMMAYEAASGETLNPSMKELANEELVITGEISQTVGQDVATLVVNDIKIHIVRDGVTDQQQIQQVVDDVIEVTEHSAAEVSYAQPVKLGDVHRDKLYDFGYKFSQQGYEYRNLQPTLERVTYNVTRNTGIDDPIVDTFETLDTINDLPVDSILLETRDEVLGEKAIINATSKVAVGDHEPEPIAVFTGDVTLTSAGHVKAKRFIPDTNCISYKDLNGKYAMMDLNGNLLTESIYEDRFDGEYGFVKGISNDKAGLLSSTGAVLIPFSYDKVEVLGNKWARGEILAPAEGDDVDYYSTNGNLIIATSDIYFIENDEARLAASMSREQCVQIGVYGPYINIKNSDGVVTTYDSTMTALRNTDYVSDFSDYNERYQLSEALRKKTGHWIGSWAGSYCVFEDNKSGKYGYMDQYGNEIVPAILDGGTYSSIENLYESNGYFIGEQDGKLVYVTAGGHITATYDCGAEEVYNYGMASEHKTDDGNISLLSADGRLTAFGTTYDYFKAVRGSKGMLWIGEQNNKYDLLDWHGNVMISGAEDYSLSDNGNYLIAQDGYDSCTLYLVNGASPVALAEGIGGAAELDTNTLMQTVDSLTPYEGDPRLTLIGEVPGEVFVTNRRIVGRNDDGLYALFDLAGHQLTNFDYEELSAAKFTGIADWIMISRNGKKGMLAPNGAEAIPCIYDYIDQLEDAWVLAYSFCPTPTATSDDYDFYQIRDDGKAYFYYETVTIYHLSSDEVTSVQLTRDQASDFAADGEYINIKDRATENVVTYDNSFTAVASARSIYSFEGLSVRNTFVKQLQDSTGMYLSDERFPDGVSRVSAYDTNTEGVIDTSGNFILPAVFANVQSYYPDVGSSHIMAHGYFCVRDANDNLGFAIQGGTITCDCKYPYNADGVYTNNSGMSLSIREKDKPYTIVSADGVESTGYSSARPLGSGLLWKVDIDNETNVIDWHGNVLLKNIYNAYASPDDKFLIVTEDWNMPAKLYAIDDATLEIDGDIIGDAPFVNTQPELPTSEREVPEEVSEEPTEEPDTRAEEPETIIAEEPETPAIEPEVPAEEPEIPAAEGSTGAGEQSAAYILLDSAAQLLAQDYNAYSVSALTLLQQAATLLDTESSPAAGVVQSAITLIDSGTGTIETVGVLLDTAKSLCQ